MPLTEVAAVAALVLAILSFSLTDAAALTLSGAIYVLYVFLFLTVLCVNSKSLRLDKFYREADAESRQQQHLAAAFLGALLLVNVVVVTVQFSLQLSAASAQGDEGHGSPGYAASAYRALQAIFFLFNLLYVLFSLRRETERIGPSTKCSASYGVFLSTVLSVTVQICALILVVVEFQDDNPLFPIWLLGAQIIFTAWSVVYDWLLTMGLIPRRCRAACIAHESVIVSTDGLTLPRERLISDL